MGLPSALGKPQKDLGNDALFWQSKNWVLLREGKLIFLVGEVKEDGFLVWGIRRFASGQFRR